MKKKTAKVISLALALVLLVAALSSCVLRLDDDEYMTREEVEALLESTMRGDVTIENSPNYNITIEGEANRNLAAAAKAVLSAVNVYAKMDIGYSNGSVSSGTAAGAGVIYKLDKARGDAIIITNYHVVYDSRSITGNKISDDIVLRLYGHEDTPTGEHPEYDIPAKFIGGSMTEDLAVLKVEASRVLAESSAVAVTFADSDAVSILDTAIAIGNPSSNGISATLGVINVDSEYVAISSSDGYTAQTQRLFRIDTAVNSGNSGGGLFNDKGELIGIVNAKSSSSSVENVGYAIPGNLAKFVVDNILYYCDGKDAEVGRKYMLGITLGSKDLAAIYDEETGRVHKTESVTVASISATAPEGVCEVGDVLRKITIDGKEYTITRMYQVIDCMFAVRPESTLVMTFESADGTLREEAIDVSKMTASVIN